MIFAKFLLFTKARQTGVKAGILHKNELGIVCREIDGFALSHKISPTMKIF